MSIDPNTPVLLGAGQFTERLDEQFEGLMPEDLAARACEAALADTGAAEALSPLIDRLACVRMFAHSVPDFIVPVIAPFGRSTSCLLYTSPSPRDATLSRMPSSA